MNDETETGLKIYKCHKTVEADKIARILKGHPESSGGSSVLLLSGDKKHAQQIKVSADWIQRHSPEVGGYYVVYEDGYASYSPAKAFESGYTLVNGTPTVAVKQNTGEEYIDWQLRVIEERDQLNSKLAKLKMFIDTEAFLDVHPTQAGMLLSQRDAMNHYSSILDDRIAAFECF